MAQEKNGLLLALSIWCRVKWVRVMPLVVGVVTLVLLVDLQAIALSFFWVAEVKSSLSVA